MRYRVVHTTRYRGESRVSVGYNEAWLKPLTTANQRLLDYQLEISPEPSSLFGRTDYFGNESVAFSFYEGYDELVVTARSEIEVLPRPAPQQAEGASWVALRESLEGRQPGGAGSTDLSVLELRHHSPRALPSPPLIAYARASFPEKHSTLRGAMDLCGRIYNDFRYDPGSTIVTTPVEEAFEQRRGVCQDFAHVMIVCVRSLGLPARYVSGYLRTKPAAGKPRLVGADASHAWASVYCGELGWVDFDPTNNVLAGVDHITVARGRDYGDIPPLRGVFIGGGQNSLEVSVDVEPQEVPHGY